MRQRVEDLELLHSDRVDLVEDVETRNVDSVAFDNVNKFVDSGVFSEDDVGRVDAVFRAY